MRKRILEGLAGISMLAVLPACHTQEQVVAEDVYAMARSVGDASVQENKVNTPVERLTKSILVPQMQIDAQFVYRQMITYITPDGELAPEVTEEKMSAYIDFPAGSTRVDPKYGNNRAELTKLKERLNTLLLSAGGKIRMIRITGYASPDGNTKENERLAGNRAIEYKNYLQKQIKLPDNCKLSVDWVGEDWDGLQRLITASDKKYSSRVLSIFQLTDDPDSRRKQIRAIDNGSVYKDIEKTFFNRLRRMELMVEIESEIIAANDPMLIEKIYTQPEKVALQDFFRVAALYRPGTEQYREVYEIAAYTYPSCALAQLNAAAAALSQGDTESARYFFNQVEGDQRAYNNLGVMALMDGDKDTAAAYFRKYMSQNPRLSRENMNILNKK